MRQKLGALCAASALLFVGDVGAYTPDAFSNSGNSNSQRLRVVEDYLDNSKCQSGVCWRMPEKEGEVEKKVDGGIMHYSGGYSFEDAVNELLRKGASVSSCVDTDGTVRDTAPKGSQTYHSGKSCYDGKVSLNGSRISNMIITPGGQKKVSDSQKDKFEFVKLKGSDRFWAKIPEDQTRAFAQNCIRQSLMYGYSPISYITSSDGTLARLPGSGPMLDYEMMFMEYGVGIYPIVKKVSEDLLSGLSEDAFIKLLGAYGYNRGKDGLPWKKIVEEIPANVSEEERTGMISKGNFFKAVKHHYFSGNLYGHLTSEDKALLLNLFATRYYLEDPIKEEGARDNKFISRVDSIIEENPEEMKGLSDFIKNWKDSYVESKLAEMRQSARKHYFEIKDAFFNEK